MRLLTPALNTWFINQNAAHSLSTCKRELTITNGLTRTSVPWRKAAPSPSSEARSHLLHPSLERRYSISSPPQKKPAAELCQSGNFTERVAMPAEITRRRLAGTLEKRCAEDVFLSSGSDPLRRSG